MRAVVGALAKGGLSLRAACITAKRVVIVSATLLLSVGCRFQAKAPPGIDFPRKTVTWTAWKTYPVRVDGRFAVSRSPSSPQEISYGLGLGITYRVGWRLDIQTPSRAVSDSECEAFPKGDLFLRGKKVENVAFSCTPLAADGHQTAEARGPWLALNAGCRSGMAGYGTSELVVEAVDGQYGMFEGHYLFRREKEVVAAVEVFTSPGNQGVWERDGMSLEEEATVAFVANALEWVSDSRIRGRICGFL